MNYFIKYFGVLIAVIFLIQSCTNPNSKVTTVAAFKPGPLDAAYATLRPKIQQFNIDNKKVNTVKAAGGTDILIPANCFVDGNGNSIEGNVQVEIVEAFSLQDFITSGLATTSDDKILMSNGMMYINAMSGDTKLQLNKGETLSVSMPTMNGADGFQMFTGDGINWQPDSTMMEEPDYEFTLPLQVLYPKGSQSLWYCIGSYPGGKDRYYCLDTTVLNLMDKKYENTCIATFAFGNRFYRLLGMTQWMCYMRRGIDPLKGSECDNNDYDLILYKEYLNHPNRSFKETDSVVKSIYVNYFKANRIKLENFCDSVNKELRHYYSNWTDTNYHFDFRKRSLEEQYMDMVTDFPASKIVEIKHFDTKGADLNSPDAFNQLRKNGVAVKEINEMLRYNFLRNQLITIMTRRNESEAAKAKVEKLYESTVFSVNKMGWINCDRFFDDPSAGKAEIYVTNTSGNNINFIDCSLIIPDMNVRLSAFPGKAGTYAFTKKEGPYTKLPIGKSAIIVGVAIQHDSLFFASKKINIKDGITIGLSMKYINAKDLNDSLKTALN